MNEKVQNLIDKYKQEIASLEMGGYYFGECDYECDQARKDNWNFN